MIYLWDGTEFEGYIDLITSKAKFRGLGLHLYGPKYHLKLGLEIQICYLRV